MRYTSSITAGSMKLPQSRAVARVLLRGGGEKAWQAAIDKNNVLQAKSPLDLDITGRIGVWVAGFFGSGKSHLIKILSSILANAPHTHEGETKLAAEFFTTKIPDPLTLADIQKAAALDEVREYVDLASQKNHPIVLYPLVERFAGRPWGWPDDETLILVARLLVMGEIQLIRGAEPIPLEDVYDQITATQKQRQTTVIRRNRPDPEKLEACRKLGQELFGEMGPSGEEALHEFLKARFADMKASLATHRAVAEAKSYPGLAEITDAQALVTAILAPRDSSAFFERLLENKAALDDLAYDYADLIHFYSHQRPQWDRLAKAYERFASNRPQLEQDTAVTAALGRMREILHAKNPYKILSEAEGLIEKVETVNKVLVEQARATSLAAIDRVTAGLEAKLAPLGSAGLSTACLARLGSLRESVGKDESLAHITQAVSLADQELEAALARIESFLKEQAKAKGGETPEVPLPPPKPRREIRPAEFVQTGWLETEADIAAFLDRLRSELKSSLDRGERIHIR